MENREFIEDDIMDEVIDITDNILLMLDNMDKKLDLIIDRLANKQNPRFRVNTNRIVRPVARVRINVPGVRSPLIDFMRNLKL